MRAICPVIDITYLIEQRRIKRGIRKQLLRLKIEDMFEEECIVNFKNGKAEYTGYVWCKQSGEKVQLGPTYNVTSALTSLA
jgi:hypothetical protein